MRTVDVLLQRSDRNAVVSVERDSRIGKAAEQIIREPLLLLSDASLKSSASNTVSPPGGDVKVNPFVSVPLCASGFVTTTLTVPAA